jgi:hypothetical protein
MLSLEVVGPDGSLSMLLLLNHNRKTTVGECPGGRKTAAVEVRRNQKTVARPSTVGTVGGDGSVAGAVWLSYSDRF